MKKILFSIFLIVIAITLFLIPKENWNKLSSLNLNKTATAFTSNITGNWNSGATWGISAPVLIPFAGPGGIALSSSGNIYVVDEGNRRVVVLNSDGSFSTSTSSHLSSPADIDISPSGDIYVADVNNVNIIRFDSHLNFIATSTAPFSDPIGIDVSPITGEVYVIDDIANKITILNPDLTASTTVSSIGFHNSQDLVISASTGDVYAAISNRVSKFSPDFTLLATSTLLSGPNGITISPLTGDVYTVDSGDNIVVRLDPIDLTVVATSSGLGLDTPLNLDISSNGDLYITDFNNNRVVVLNPDLSTSTIYNGLTISATEGTDYPGLSDNVTIESGQTVTLQQDQNVHDITLSTGGTLNFNGHILNVYGNFNWDGGTLIKNGGSINFADMVDQIIFEYKGNSSPGQLVDSSGNSPDLIQYGDPEWLTTNPPEGDHWLGAWDSASTSDVDYYSFSIGTKPHNNRGTLSFDFGYIHYSIGDNLQVYFLETCLDDPCTGQGDRAISIDWQAGLFRIDYSTFNGNASIDTANSGAVGIFLEPDEFKHAFAMTWDASIPETDFYIDNNLVASSTEMPDFGTGNYLNPNSPEAASIGSSQEYGDTDVFAIDDIKLTTGSYVAPTFTPAPSHHRRRVVSTSTPLEASTATSTESTTTFAITTTIATTTIPGIDQTVFVFEKNLKRYDTDPDVMTLQKFLNTHNFVLATSGYGSLGHETDYFGPLTENSVIRFQESYPEDILDPLHLTKGTGIFHIYSRKKANEILNQEK